MILSLGVAKSGAGLLGRLFIFLSSVDAFVRIGILVGAGLAILLLVAFGCMGCAASRRIFLGARLAKASANQQSRD